MEHSISALLGQTALLTSCSTDWCLPSGERKAGSVLVLMQWSCFEEKNCSNFLPELNNSQLVKASGTCPASE